jgi:hypothetical protein
MKAIKPFLLSVLMLAGLCVHAQSVDEIVSENTTAMGGKEKLGSLKSVKMTGSMTVQGTDVNITMTKSHMAGWRMEMDIMGTSNYRVANTSSGWVYMPVMGMTEPKEMEADQFKSAVNQVDVQGTLFNYKEKGTTIEFLGKEKLDAGEAYKLKVTFKNGETANYFVDVNTKRLVKVASKMTFNGQEMDIETSFSDFKQNADGYWFPFTTSTSQGTITYDKIETNVPVKDDMFVK